LSRTVVNVSDAFAFGQVYVALSSAPFEGLSISGEAFTADSIKVHPRVKSFYDKIS
jgi:hypothetical protein